MLHKAVFFKWVNGIITSFQKEFQSLEQAILGLDDEDYEYAKIYDHRARIVHEDRKHHKHHHDHPYA